MSNKLLIHGVVACYCGDQIISNSGKVLGNTNFDTLCCWRCGADYGMDYCYSKREENQHVQLTRDDQLKSLILKTIQEWSNEQSWADGMWYGYKSLQDDVVLMVGEPVSMYKIKKLTKQLKNEGFIVLEPTYDSDYVLGGSGYFYRGGLRIEDMKRQLEELQAENERLNNEIPPAWKRVMEMRNNQLDDCEQKLLEANRMLDRAVELIDAKIFELGEVEQWNDFEHDICVCFCEYYVNELSDDHCEGHCPLGAMGDRDCKPAIRKMLREAVTE